MVNGSKYSNSCIVKQLNFSDKNSSKTAADIGQNFSRTESRTLEPGLFFFCLYLLYVNKVFSLFACIFFVNNGGSVACCRGFKKLL